MPGYIEPRSTTASLEDLVTRARQGEEILITEGGRVVAKIVAVEPLALEGATAERERLAAQRRSLFGMFAGQHRVSDDAFEPDEELTDSFYAENQLPMHGKQGTDRSPK